MSPYSKHYCDFQRLLLFRNKAINAGRFRKNAGMREICQNAGISRTIAGRLTPMRRGRHRRRWLDINLLENDCEDWPTKMWRWSLNVRKVSKSYNVY